MQTKKHCRNVTICLVGENRFQNNLLISNLKRTHSCKCNFIVCACPSGLPSRVLNGTNNRCLVFLDCFKLNRFELDTLLISTCQKKSANTLLALYNLAEDTGFEKSALNYGCRGCFYSNNTLEDICRGIRTMLNEEAWLPRKVMSDVILSSAKLESRNPPAEISNVASLSTREKEILALLATGVTNAAIATELFISSHTVRTHLYNIYRKLKVKNRMQASLWVSQNLPSIRI